MFSVLESTNKNQHYGTQKPWSLANRNIIDQLIMRIHTNLCPLSSPNQLLDFCHRHSFFPKKDQWGNTLCLFDIHIYIYICIYISLRMPYHPSWRTPRHPPKFPSIFPDDFRTTAVIAVPNCQAALLNRSTAGIRMRCAAVDEPRNQLKLPVIVKGKSMIWCKEMHGHVILECFLIVHFFWVANIMTPVSLQKKMSKRLQMYHAI